MRILPAHGRLYHMSNSSWSRADILALRRRLGLSQDELASVLNLTRKAISHWETGHCGPTGTAVLCLDRLAAAGPTTSGVISENPTESPDTPVDA